MSSKKHKRKASESSSSSESDENSSSSDEVRKREKKTRKPKHSTSEHERDSGSDSKLKSRNKNEEHKSKSLVSNYTSKHSTNDRGFDKEKDHEQQRRKPENYRSNYDKDRTRQRSRSRENRDQNRRTDSRQNRDSRFDNDHQDRYRGDNQNRYKGDRDWPRGRGSYRGKDRDNRNRRSRSGSYDHKNAKWGKEGTSGKSEDKGTKDKEKPNFGLSGKLTEETNMYRGVVIKYSEPPEARKPRRRWRLYPFKGDKALQTLFIHRESAYLIGRERKVVDLAVDHPSCSKQHAALQYRLVSFTRDDGSAGKRVRPYIIDLESANGTFINGKKIDPKKYVELLERDVIKFGFSSREYVLLHENSKDEAMDDDVKMEEEEVVVKNEPN